MPNIIVKIGDRVLKGQILAEPVANLSAATHASTSGYVKEIKPMNIPHPSGLPDQCVVLETDGKDEWIRFGEQGAETAGDPKEKPYCCDSREWKS